jgi:hypothetical protein
MWITGITLDCGRSLLHVQKASTGISGQGRGHKVLKTCLKIYKICNILQKNTIIQTGSIFMAVNHIKLGRKRGSKPENIQTEPLILQRFINVRAKRLFTNFYVMQKANFLCL